MFHHLDQGKARHEDIIHGSECHQFIILCSPVRHISTQLLFILTDLETPEVLVVKVSGLSISVQWRTVMDAAEYALVIEETATNQAPQVRVVQGDFYTETGLKPWTTYCVRVAAKYAGNNSDFSQPICRNTESS